jgi:hypothetical protein
MGAMRQATATMRRRVMIVLVSTMRMVVVSIVSVMPDKVISMIAMIRRIIVIPMILMA